MRQPRGISGFGPTGISLWKKKWAGGLTQGVGNEPWDSLKGSHRGWFMGGIPSFPAESQLQKGQCNPELRIHMAVVVNNWANPKRACPIGKWNQRL